jgi:hypothetical protein
MVDIVMEQQLVFVLQFMKIHPIVHLLEILGVIAGRFTYKVQSTQIQ